MILLLNAMNTQFQTSSQTPSELLSGISNCSDYWIDEEDTDKRQDHRMSIIRL